MGGAGCCNVVSGECQFPCFFLAPSTILLSEFLCPCDDDEGISIPVVPEDVELFWNLNFLDDDELDNLFTGESLCTPNAHPMHTCVAY